MREAFQKHFTPSPPPQQNEQTQESFSKEKETRNFVFYTVHSIRPAKKKKNVPQLQK